MQDDYTSILILDININTNNINTFQNINPETFSKIFKSAPKIILETFFKKQTDDIQTTPKNRHL